jgi:hypothetical protein
MYEPHNPSSGRSDCHTDIGAVPLTINTDRNAMHYCNQYEDQDDQNKYNRNNHKVYGLIFYSANVTMKGKELGPCNNNNNGCWLPIIIQHDDGSELL